MDLKKLVKKLGGTKIVARKMNVVPSTVRVWMGDGYIPPKHHAGIMELASEKGLRINRDNVDFLWTPEK